MTRSPRLRIPICLWLAALILAVVALWAVAAQWIVPDARAQNLMLGVTRTGTPGHIFGTDNLGRDIWSLTIAGARSAVIGPVLIAIGATTIGLLLGAPAGWRGGALDAAVGRGTDLVLALPPILLAIVVAGVIDGGYWVTVALLMVLFSPADVRLVRSAVAAERGKPYIEAPRVLGIRSPRIVLRHVLPNVLPVVLANLFLNVAVALVAMSSLSFLGLGVSPGTADWGRQLSDARGLLFTNPAAAVVPGVAIIVVATAVNLIGDWLGERFTDDDDGGLFELASAEGPGEAAAAQAAAEDLDGRGLVGGALVEAGLVGAGLADGGLVGTDPNDAAPALSDAALAARDVRVVGPQGEIVHGVSFAVPAGQTIAIIGESGSGKSLTAKALTGLLPPGLTTSGSAWLAGAPLDLNAPERSWRAARSHGIVLLMQDPFTSLSPMQRCGPQVAAALPPAIRRNRRLCEAEVQTRLTEVGLPPRVARAYPFELSGGQRQRVAIAAALAADPQVLIADEPTTALDVTTEAEILDLLARLQADRGLAVVLITHDLRLAADRAERVIVMQRGDVVESGPAASVLEQPQHAYTQELLAAIPALDGPVEPADSATGGTDNQPILTIAEAGRTFAGTRTELAVRALGGVSLTVRPGECVAIVGESGSGKTTLARAVVDLETLDTGRIELASAQQGGLPFALDRDSERADSSAPTQRRDPRTAQIVFQDPYSALNPALTIGATLTEALRVAGRPASDVPELLAQVALPASYANRRPRALSGGERQRVAIARALAPRPQLLVCDEPTSALDVTTQAEIIALLRRLRDDLGLAILFVSHDLAVVRQVANYVVVMEDGLAVEEGPVAQVFGHPKAEFTKRLLASVPGADQSSLPGADQTLLPGAEA